MSSSADFEYLPLHVYDTASVPEVDFVIATERDLDQAVLIEALRGLSHGVVASSLLNIHPLFWWRVELSTPLACEAVERAVEAAGVPVRYVASARHGSQRLGAPADFSKALGRRGHGWNARPAQVPIEASTPGRWFMGERGVSVERSVCGTGAGTRLAVIDNDGRDIEKTSLDGELLIGVDRVPRACAHAAMLVGWAVGARGEAGTFVGVAPDCSPRLYCIPKPGTEVFALPVAIVRAVDEGADVVVCATYVDGQTSPMLDDALEFAARLGRDERGAAVVLPASREMSSPVGSVHASLSLGLGEPASDPRVFCIGPTSQSGDWFLWRDKRGKFHPFANRGPALRWMAPGDDMAYPFAEPERPAHAESSGAAGIAAGVLLLVLGKNPDLTLLELDALLTKTITSLNAADQAHLPDLADKHDLMPLETDRDGHNAKLGYGRLHTRDACLSAIDPIAAALIEIGESESATAYVSALSANQIERPFSPAVGRWTARVLLCNARLRHGLKALARTFRLWTSRPPRAAGQPVGAVLRQALILLRGLAQASELDAAPEVRHELEALEVRVRDLLVCPALAARVESAVLETWLSFAVPDVQPHSSETLPKGDRSSSERGQAQQTRE